MNNHYLIVKEKNKKTITYFEYDKLNGFNMTSKNKNIKLKDAINVNKMIIINPSFIEKLVNKKINNKIKKLIDLIANIYNNTDDEDPAGTLMQALNEVERFKRQMINKYEEYMTKEQIKLLEKKILEQEVTMRAYYINEKQIPEEVEYETHKAR